jgi:hypothetical protein
VFGADGDLFTRFVHIHRKEKKKEESNSKREEESRRKKMTIFSE